MAEETTVKEVSQEERDLRKEVWQEIQSGVTPEPPEKAGQAETVITDPDPVQTEEQKTDPWATVDPVLKEAIDKLNTSYQEVEQLKERLKQAENRVGGIDNRLRDLRNQPVPTKEEISKALKSDKAWQDFEEDFPSHAEALINAVSLGSKSAVGADVIAQMREELKTDFNERLTKQQLGFELKLLRSRHPNHIELIKEPTFLPWLEQQPEEMQAKYGSMDATDGIVLLDSYLKSKTPTKEPPNILAERQARLDASASTHKGSKIIKQKTEAEMTEAELRRHYAKQIWGK